MTTPTKEMAEAALRWITEQGGDVAYTEPEYGEIVEQSELFLLNLKHVLARLTFLEAQNAALRDALIEIRKIAALMCSHRNPPENIITAIVDGVIKPQELQSPPVDKEGV